MRTTQQWRQAWGELTSPRVSLGESCSDYLFLSFPGRKRSAAASIKSLLLEAREAGSCSGMSVLLCKASSDLALEVMHQVYSLLIIRKFLRPTQIHKKGITLALLEGKQQDHIVKEHGGHFETCQMTHTLTVAKAEMFSPVPWVNKTTSAHLLNTLNLRIILASSLSWTPTFNAASPGSFNSTTKTTLKDIHFFASWLQPPWYKPSLSLT